MKGPRLPCGYQMKWPMPRDGKSSPLFHAVRPSRVPAHSLRQIFRPIRSASASEIVAGALQDRGRAELLGERTYGKGVFQQVIELSNGGALDITSGQYFTPKGRNLGGRGVRRGAGLEPDIAVAAPRGARRDVQLDAAARRLGCVKR